MPQVTGHHYVLAVPDAQASADFYVEIMGFKLKPVVDEGWRFVERNGFRIMLGTCPDDIHPSKLGSHSYFAYFNMDDVDGYYEEIISRGGEPLTALEDKPWNMREFAMMTLDGHRIMMGQPIH